MQSPDRMSPLELRAAVGLASVFGLRMLGMFIILPVFVLYARDLPGGHNQTLIGLALGVYGLAQACFQLPFGWLSDHWGRKRAIYLGLIVFAAGSFLAGTASDLYMVAVGRAVQGAGAISAAVIALTADLTTTENRTKSMAIIGMTIGATFALSMVAGPALSHAVGVPGIFLMTGVLSLAAMLVVRVIVPDPPVGSSGGVRPTAVPVMDVLRDAQLARLNLGIFSLHAILMAIFVVVPVKLAQHLPAGAHWKIYLAVMLAGVAIMVPIMLVSERRGRQKAAFVGAVAVVAAATILLGVAGDRLTTIVASLTLFFAAFNLLEASLPSLVSKFAPAKAKGTAIGVYSTLQFVGTFVGATAGGWLAQHYGTKAVFGFCAAVAGIWLVVASGIRMPEASPRKASSRP